MMLGKATSLVLFLSFATSALAQCEAPVPCQDEELNRLNTTDCTTYHAFIARGSDSGYPGHLGGLIKLVNGNLTSDSKTTFGYENIVYPARSWAAGKDTWCQSAAQGATGGQKQMTDYANRCPDAKLILLGYSQGGSVGLDILGGGGGPVFECTQEDNPPLDRSESPGSKIVVAAIFGAVRRSAHQNYTVKGGKEYHGKAERTSDQLAGLAKYSSILREWCNTGDPMCAANSSPLDVAQHLNYFKLYNDEAAKWVVGTAKGEKVADAESSALETKSATKSATATKTATKTSAKHVETAASTPTATGKTGVQGNAQEQTQGSGAVDSMAGVVTAWLVAVGAFASFL